MRLRSAHRLIGLGLLTSIALLATVFPAGQRVRVRLGQTISSATAKSGESWEGTLASDVVVDGKTVAKKGAPVRGRVAEAKSSGRLSSPGILRLKVTSINGMAVNSNSIS